MLKKKDFAELIQALSSPRLWALLAWLDIQQRYRRSVLGPLWLTLSTGIVVGTLGLLWSKLFSVDIETYLPFFAIGYIAWTFISQQLNEACFSFIQFEGIIKQSRLPLPVFVLRILTRNFIIFFHNVFIIVLIIAFTHLNWQWGMMVSIAGLAILSATLFGLSCILGVMCTRFRDVGPIVQNFTAIAFYLTPIMWRPETLGADHQWIIACNPIAQSINIIRAPLLGEAVAVQSWGIALFAMLISLVCGCACLAAYRNRIAYWL